MEINVSTLSSLVWLLLERLGGSATFTDEEVLSIEHDTIRVDLGPDMRGLTITLEKAKP